MREGQSEAETEGSRSIGRSGGRGAARVRADPSARYAAIVTAFARGDIQLGWFGGLTFLRAEQIGGMEPLVMRDVDLDFTSTFLVLSTSSAASIKDLAGKSIAFGSELSTSGNLMPRHFLRAEGTVADDFFGEIHHNGELIHRLKASQRARRGIVLCPERRRLFAESKRRVAVIHGRTFYEADRPKAGTRRGRA